MDEDMKRLVDRWVAVFREMPVLLDAGLMRPMIVEAERKRGLQKTSSSKT